VNQQKPIGQLVIELLLARGPMTSAEIASELDRPYEAVRARIGDGRRGKKRLFYIADFGEVASRGYKRPAMYAAGDRPDAPYPHLGLTQKYKRKWQRTKTKKRIKAMGPGNHFATLIAQVTQ
jgi:hypothetical protein